MTSASRSRTIIPKKGALSLPVVFRLLNNTVVAETTLGLGWNWIYTHRLNRPSWSDMFPKNPLKTNLTSSRIGHTSPGGLLCCSIWHWEDGNRSSVAYSWASCGWYAPQIIPEVFFVVYRGSVSLEQDVRGSFSATFWWVVHPQNARITAYIFAF